jgi:pimeloyl-ACP methyl ester carboxylesterase
MNIDLQLARQCFHFANLAYEEAHDEEKSTSTQWVYGGLANDPEVIFVGLRGTKEIRDFLTDSRFAFKAKWPSSELIRIHRGVAAAVDSIFARVVKRVDGFKKIYVVGHSLGGMKAQALALRLKQTGFNIEGVEVFGSPRVGNGYFRNYYNSQLGNITLRWEAEGDPFPYSPPLIFNYRHAGRAAYLKNDGRVILEPTFVDHIPAYIETILPKKVEVIGQELFAFFNPHHRTNYQDLLANVKEAA